MTKASQTEYEYSKIKSPDPIIPRKKIDLKAAITATLLLIMSLVTVGIMIKGLFVRIQLAEQSDKSVDIKQKLSLVQEENRRLRIKYESSIDLDEIESYATNRLGMQKPGNSRIKKIDIETQDRAIVLGDSEKSKTVG